jgi:ribosome-binding protein aMBF1 (putative translation factor)
MITNERQYAITRAQAEQFKESLTRFGSAEQKLDPVVRGAMRLGLQSQLKDLQAEIAEYEALKAGTTRKFVSNSLADLAVGLIKARIARGLTQRELAEKLNINERQIQRYESTLYEGAALRRLQEVADALNVKIREEITLER